MQSKRGDHAADTCQGVFVSGNKGLIGCPQVLTIIPLGLSNQIAKENYKKKVQHPIPKHIQPECPFRMQKGEQWFFGFLEGEAQPIPGPQVVFCLTKLEE